MPSKIAFDLTELSFEVPSLGWNKKVKVLCPPSGGPYPLLIVHDGRYAFKKDTPLGYETLALDEAISEASFPMVVAAIEEEEWEQRTKEYSPFAWTGPAEHFLPEGQEKGKEYASWVVSFLLPFLRNSFPCLEGQRNAFMLGSSLGALISVYISASYPDIFSKIGCFSLASWGNEEALLDSVRSSKISKCNSFFIRVGTNEGLPRGILEFKDYYPKMSEDFVSALQNKGVGFDFKINEGRSHKTKEWALDMPSFISFLKK